MKDPESITLGKLTWTLVQEPEPEVLYALKEKYKFHDLDVEDCLSENQRSKIDEYEDYLFIILHIPVYDSRKQRVSSEEINIFIKNEVVITIHWGDLDPLLKLFELCEKEETERKKLMGLGSGYLLYEIIDQMFADSFPILDTLERSITSLERDVFSLSIQRDMLKDILVTKKNIITFRRLIAPERTVVAQIEHKNKKFLPDTLDIYFDDVLDKVEKIWNTLENQQELIESLQDTNESIISHTTNNVIKILTVFSVMIMPLTFITGLYGMNVALPYAEGEQMFLSLAAVMGSILAVMLIFFKLKRWI